MDHEAGEEQEGVQSRRTQYDEGRIGMIERDEEARCGQGLAK